MVRKSLKKVAVDTSSVKTLLPKDVDTKYFGGEPLFTIQPDARTSALAYSFTWYNRFYGRKEAKEQLINYLDINGRTDEVKIIRKVDDNALNPTICWLARMTLRGLQLTEHEEATLQNDITRLIKVVTAPQVKETSKTGGKKDEPVKESNRPNVQEIMKERAREAAGELEGMFDDFLGAGAKAQHSFKPMDEVARKNVLPQHISYITDIWKKKQSEYEEVLKGKDAQLVQAYSYLNKTQIKNTIKFIEQVVGDLNSYISVKKAAKAPRARKAVPVEKVVAKLKYLKVFKDPAIKLDLLSISPVKLHGSSECFLYDTAKRKLVYLCADEYSKTFTVKGTTVLGFDSGKSQTKILRKPGDQLRDLLKLGKPASRKFFDEIKAVSVTPNGRTNENMIILKAW